MKKQHLLFCLTLLFVGVHSLIFAQLNDLKIAAHPRILLLKGEEKNLLADIKKRQKLGKCSRRYLCRM